MDGLIPELEPILRPLEDPVLCFSGGMDSTVLLRNMKEYCDDFKVVFVRVPMNSERQAFAAEDICSYLDVELYTMEIGWEDMPGIRRNDADRCYICKKSIFSFASDLGRPLICGDNADDRDDLRPGHRAGDEFGVLRPLRDAGIGKARIRKAIAEMYLPVIMIKDTCMATRYPENTHIGEFEMRFAEDCEDAVRRVSGLRQLRVRINNDRALVQTDESELDELVRHRTQITYELKCRGLDCDLDLNGYKEV